MYYKYHDVEKTELRKPVKRHNLVNVNQHDYINVSKHSKVYLMGAFFVFFEKVHLKVHLIFTLILNIILLIVFCVIM